MSVSEKLVVITNERVFSDGTNYFCDNVDIKTILEGLSNKFEIIACCRSSKKTRPVRFIASKDFIINSVLMFVKSIYLITSNKKMPTLQNNVFLVMIFENKCLS